MIMCSFGMYWRKEDVWKSNEEMVVDEDFKEIFQEDLAPEQSKII